jgi:hypothetical protein
VPPAPAEQQGVAEGVETDYDGVDTDLRPARAHVEPHRREDVVAQEAAAVDRAARPLPQLQLERRQRAVGPGEVDREHREGERRVHQHEPRHPQRHEGTGQHQQHDDAVQHRDRTREQPHRNSVALRRRCRSPPRALAFRRR